MIAHLDTRVELLRRGSPGDPVDLIHGKLPTADILPAANDQGVPGQVLLEAGELYLVGIILCAVHKEELLPFLHPVTNLYIYLINPARC